MVYESWFTIHSLRAMVYEPWFTIHSLRAMVYRSRSQPPLMGIALQDGQIGTPGNYGGNIIKPPSWKNCSSFVGTIMQLLQSLATKTFRKVWVA